MSAWRRGALGALVLTSLAGALLGACRDPAAAAGTAALIEVTFNEGLQIDQLAFSVREGDELLDEVVLPEAASEPLRSPQTLRLLLRDALGGSVVEVEVTGLAQGAPVASGSGAQEMVRGLERKIEVPLFRFDGQDAGADAGDDAGVDGGSGPDAGGDEDAGTDAGQDLPDGGCGPTTFEACGQADSDGGVCVACGDTSDRCVDGSCQCGSSPPCGGGQTCSAGSCSCDGTVCPGGQRCENNQCVCDELSCSSGCCEGGACLGRTFATCGVMGNTCVACTSDTANTCNTSGECRCGQNPPCGAGLRCNNGQCICDTMSCPGCCLAGICQSGTSNSACGKGGVLCQQCPLLTTCGSDGTC